MTDRHKRRVPAFLTSLKDHLGQTQQRNATFLMLNGVTGAFTGLLFWLLFTRLLALPADQVGIGYATVALGTIVGLVAKGGLDTAIVRTVPGASSREGARLLRFSMTLGAGVALALALLLAGVSRFGSALPALPPLGWALVAAIGALMVVTWLQDAYFLAEGDARFSFQRNLVLSGTRLVLPLLVFVVALPDPVALTWGMALLASAMAAAYWTRMRRPRDGVLVPRRQFLGTATRNVAGNAAEFLPGLLLVPITLAMSGPAAAAYFGMAWTAASLLFLASAAISRSALAEMVRPGAGGLGLAVRRGAVHHLWTVVPAAIVGVVVAPLVLGVFGADYAREGAPVFVLLCLSVVVVGPTYLYLAVLRAQDRTRTLTLFPLAMVGALFTLAPLLEHRLGLIGIAVAWFVANAPFGVWAMIRLHQTAKEVHPHVNQQSIGRSAHLE